MKEAKKWFNGLDKDEQQGKSMEYFGLDSELLEDYDIKELYDFYYINL